MPDRIDGILGAFQIGDITITYQRLIVIIGFASLRISGVYFAITSLTIAEILRLVTDNWIGLTKACRG